MTYLAFLSVCLKQIHHSVVHEPVIESLQASTAERVKQVVVQIVCLEVPERVVVQFQGCRFGMITEVGQLRGDVVRVPWMSAECIAYSLLGKSLEIDRRCVVVVDSVSQGIVNQFVGVLLIHDILPTLVLLHREAHTSVTQQGNHVPVARILTHLHLTVLQHIFTGTIVKDGLGCLLRGARSGKSHGSHGRCPGTGLFEKFSSVNILFHIHGICRDRFF